MPTSINAQLKAAESGMGMPLQLLAAAVFCTIFGPFFTAGFSFIASILALAASFSSGQACCGGGNSTGEDWSEVRSRENATITVAIRPHWQLQPKSASLFLHYAILTR